MRMAHLPSTQILPHYRPRIAGGDKKSKLLIAMSVLVRGR